MGKKNNIAITFGNNFRFCTFTEKKYINNNHDDVIYTACSLLS